MTDIDDFDDPLQEETQEEEVDVEDEVTQDRRSDPQSKESELEILDFNASQSHFSHVNAMNIHSQEDESLWDEDFESSVTKRKGTKKYLSLGTEDDDDLLGGVYSQSSSSSSSSSSSTSSSSSSSSSSVALGSLLGSLCEGWQAWCRR